MLLVQWYQKVAPVPRHRFYHTTTGLFMLQFPGMSERGGGERDVSPRQASMRNDKTSSKGRGSWGKEIMEAVSCNLQLIPSTSQLPPTSEGGAQMINEKLNRLTTLLSSFFEKCSAEEVVASSDFRGFRDCSTSDELPDVDSDPMVGLDGLISPFQQFSDACIDQQEDVFQNALADLAGSFWVKRKRGIHCQIN